MLAGMDGDALAIIITIIGTGLAGTLALAGLLMRTAARQDRRMDRFEDAMTRHRDRFEAATAAHRDRFEDAMTEHRAEMHRLAERQSHVEGRLDERGAAADD